MPTIENQKKCHSCEEVIHTSTSTCPYCGTEVSSEATAAAIAQELYQEAPPEPYHPSPYTPPTNEIGGEVEDSPFHVSASEPMAPSPEENQGQAEVPISSGDGMREVLVPLALLLAGSVFFLFGLVLMLYSRDGVFTLHWNGDAWPVYLGSSLLMLFGGWRLLQRVRE